MFWNTVFTALMFKATWDAGHYYSYNRVRNFEYFKNESWGQYMRLRATPALFLGWMVFRFYSEVPICEYPFF
jgi:hypothetical protein